MLRLSTSRCGLINTRYDWLLAFKQWLSCLWVYRLAQVGIGVVLRWVLRIRWHSIVSTLLLVQIWVSRQFSLLLVCTTGILSSIWRLVCALHLLAASRLIDLAIVDEALTILLWQLLLLRWLFLWLLEGFQVCSNVKWFSASLLLLAQGDLMIKVV